MRDLVIALIFVLITSIQVYYDKDVKVVVEYNLDGAEKIGSVLFGVEEIKDEVLAIFKSNDYNLEKMDFEKAVVIFKTDDYGSYRFFEGVKLSHPVNMTILLPCGYSFNITSDEIPQAFIFE
jgi:hypothetical protein